jgi:hypothetical protein
MIITTVPVSGEIVSTVKKIVLLYSRIGVETILKVGTVQLGG